MHSTCTVQARRRAKGSRMHARSPRGACKLPVHAGRQRSACVPTREACRERALCMQLGIRTPIFRRRQDSRRMHRDSTGLAARRHSAWVCRHRECTPCRLPARHTHWAGSRRRILGGRVAWHPDQVTVVRVIQGIDNRVDVKSSDIDAGQMERDLRDQGVAELVRLYGRRDTQNNLAHARQGALGSRDGRSPLAGVPAASLIEKTRDRGALPGHVGGASRTSRLHGAQP